MWKERVFWYLGVCDCFLSLCVLVCSRRGPRGGSLSGGSVDVLFIQAWEVAVCASGMWVLTNGDWCLWCVHVYPGWRPHRWSCPEHRDQWLSCLLPGHHSPVCYLWQVFQR